MRAAPRAETSAALPLSVASRPCAAGTFPAAPDAELLAREPTVASAPALVSSDLPACDEDAPEPTLDANKLHVYAVALELHALCATLVGPLTRVVRDQLERASLSVVLNTAEAGGRRSRRDKARYYMIARGSATETAALLDVLALRHLAPAGAIRTGRRLAIRVVQMLTRMDQRLGS